MKKFLLFVVIISITGLWACTPSADQAEKAAETESIKDEPPKKDAEVTMLPNGVMKRDGITLTPMTDSPEYPDARLTLKSSTKMKAGKNKVDFGVEKYELGSQTSDAESKMCANSGKGQHIHFIVDNKPYSAHYESSFETEIGEGNHVLLAFLSRSYHESLKHDGAAVLTNLVVGNPEKSISAEESKAFLSQPHMFYSRPKGEYVGKDIEKVMLDFYLVNTDLSAEGNKVKATINGSTFMIDKWQPYLMEGLSEGDVTIELELVDNSGKLVEGPFNKVQRTVKLFKDEPLN